MSRTPAEIRSTRIGALARLPAFFALENKRAVVAGGSPAATWKAELLSAAGARVEVFAAAPGEEMLALAGAPPRGVVVLRNRNWTPEDFAGAAIAVADCADDQEAAAFATAARAAGVPVNVIDRPAFCDFSFGAIVNRSPLIIGISTDGASPVFGQAIRAKIEALIPKGFARWADAARAWRPRVQALALPFRGRRNFWERFTDRAVAAPNAAPTDADLDALLAPTSAASSGSVILVGAGPGDPDLLTIKAARLISAADVVVYDALVAPAVMDLINPKAERIYAGKERGNHALPQNDINLLLVRLAKTGKRVVRLKGGDPFTFGRGGEEVETLSDHGIPVEVVPGITAAAGVAAYAGIPLTHRNYAQACVFVTGHLKDHSVDLNWPALAQANQTIVIYMGVTALETISAKLQQAGLPGDTPAALIYRATWPTQHLYASTLASLPETARTYGVKPPALIVIGSVVRLRNEDQPG